MSRRKLAADLVHEMRTSKRTDRYFADREEIGLATVQKARTGKSYRDHPTPPIALRKNRGPNRPSEPRPAIPACERDTETAAISRALRNWPAPPREISA